MAKQIFVVKVYEEGEFIGYVDQYIDLTNNENNAALPTMEEAKERRDEAVDSYPDCMVVAEAITVDDEN